MVSTIVTLTWLALALFIGVTIYALASALSDYIKGKNRGKNLAVIFLLLIVVLLMLNIFKQYLGIMGGM